METKPLIYGLIGFFIGGLLVSVAAQTFDKPVAEQSSMSQMTADLTNKNGDDYDKAFISHMIEHHESAVDMARLSGERAKNQEIKTLSAEIISAQESEISKMKDWQKKWGYEQMTDSMQHGTSH